MPIFNPRPTRAEIESSKAELERRMQGYNTEADAKVDPIINRISNTPYTAVIVVLYSVLAGCASVWIYKSLVGC